jgi:NAD(P)H-nitrite reductase large subunit
MMQIVPEVESFTGGNGVRFVDGKEMAFDAVIFATGYRSNVPFWLKVRTSSPAASSAAPSQLTGAT